MTRLLVLVAPLLLVAFSARAADEPKGEKVAYTVHTGHFEKNTSPLKGEVSFAAFTDKESFDKVFGTVPPLMKGKKNNPVAPTAFDKSLAAVVITRGKSITTYAVEKVTLDKDGALYVQYKATAGPPGSANFASPLIVTVPKDGVKKVVFLSGGKTVGTAEVK